MKCAGSEPRVTRFFKLSPPFSVLSPTVWPYLAIAALTLVFFHKLAFSGMILARGDMYSYFYPYWHIRNTLLMAGQIPLWTPDIFMGAPLLANSQIGLFYPPNWFVISLDAPTAITVSLLAHVGWAMAGAYRLARATLGLDQVPALVGAAVFGLGGYMGAKAENINQFQALAWMPWLFLVLHLALNAQTRRKAAHFGLLLGMGLALQLLAGHPQTVFITAVGMGVYALTVAAMPFRWRFGWKERLRAIGRALVILAGAGVIGVILAAPQVIPTLELIGASNRSGGLNPQQAMAFSLNPWIIGRGLLPSYDSLLFGEYLAYVGVIGLGLAVVGVFNRGVQSSPIDPAAQDGGAKRQPWIVLLVVGFGLALGLYNPLYWTLAGLPGFSFFRVPARWLALFALAGAMLAGIGLQALRLKRPAWWVFALIAGLVGGLARASFLADVMAMDVIGPAEPTARTLAGWALAGGALLAGLWFAPSPPSPLSLRARGSLGQWWMRYGVSVLGVLAVVELFAASRVLAYNEVAPSDTFTAQRFTISQLRAYAAEQTPPGRVLSISQALFDPGDIEALTRRYRALGMSDLAIRIALVDTKLRDLLAANLPLAWGVPSVDGFDGGLLPSGDYSAFTSLMLPPGEDRSSDGRLREMLAQAECRGACIPEQRWLNLTNTRYLIVDKVYDLWQDDVAYDTTFTVRLEVGERTTIDPIPVFEADSLHILCEEPCSPLVTFRYGDGSVEDLEPASDTALQGYRMVRYTVESARAPVHVDIRADGTAINLQAVTLVDARTGDFQQVTLGAWKRVLSSDIKLYENLNVTPRAYFVIDYTVQIAKDTESGLEMMRQSGGGQRDFASALVIPNYVQKNSSHLPLDPSIDVKILEYTSERVEIAVHAGSQAGLLVLSDAFYPGWTATVNGEPAKIYRTNIMFRGVAVPAGESTVVFEYKPWWWPGILVFGAVAWLVAVVGLRTKD